MALSNNGKGTVTAAQLDSVMDSFATKADNRFKKTADNDTWYGSSSTTNNTTEKSVTCANFVLKKGAVISVLFSTSNTANAPTLNVNSTGAKTIYYGSSAVSSTNAFKWLANTLITFIYDGTYYRVISVTPELDGGVYYGTCGTSASTSEKTGTCANFRLQTGSLIYLKMTYAQTYVSGALTLNVNSTGSKTIYYNNAATSSSNKLEWNAGDVIPFIYDGSYWVCLKSSSSGGDSGSAYIESYTMTASGWDGSTNIYSFESKYPSSSYNIDISPCNLTTSAQLSAYSAANMIGNISSNIVTANGTIPTIDIVVMVTVFPK